MFGEKLLQVRLDTVLLKPRVDAEFMGGVVEHFCQADLEGVAIAAPHFPTGCERLADQCCIMVQLGRSQLDQRTRGTHPVQRFVGTVVSVDRD
jgi:hypothetical protein